MDLVSEICIIPYSERVFTETTETARRVVHKLANLSNAEKAMLVRYGNPDVYLHTFESPEIWKGTTVVSHHKSAAEAQAAIDSIHAEFKNKVAALKARAQQDGFTGVEFRTNA